MKPEKLPSGNYRIRVYNKYTGKKESFTAPTIKEAKMLAAEYSLRISAADKDDCTVKEAIRRFIDKRSKVLSPSTIRGYEMLYRNNYEEIGHYSIEKLTSEIIQSFVNNLSSDKSPKTVRNIYGLLISSIKAIKPNKAITVTLPTKKPVERHIPTDKEVQEMLELSSGDLKKGIILASVGTLRRGEVCALKYEDIEGNIIHVHADMVINPYKEWVYKDMPKTASSDRYIEMPQKAIEQLGTGSGFVVQSNPTTLTCAFQRLRNKMGIKCRFHDLRHYAASIMHAIGVPDAYIMERGGWSSDGILKQVYRNALDDKSREFANKTNDYLSKFF